MFVKKYGYSHTLKSKSDIFTILLKHIFPGSLTNAQEAANPDAEDAIPCWQEYGLPPKSDSDVGKNTIEKKKIDSAVAGQPEKNTRRKTTADASKPAAPPTIAKPAAPSPIVEPAELVTPSEPSDVGKNTIEKKKFDSDAAVAGQPPKNTRRKTTADASKAAATPTIAAPAAPSPIVKPAEVVTPSEPSAAVRVTPPVTLPGLVVTPPVPSPILATPPRVPFLRRSRQMIPPPAFGEDDLDWQILAMNDA